jgi:hypothetical protein
MAYQFAIIVDQAAAIAGKESAIGDRVQIPKGVNSITARHPGDCRRRPPN